MDITGFTHKKTGDLVPIESFYGGAHAFIPYDLPPSWRLPSDLTSLLVEARVELARLDAGARQLPGAELLRVPLQLREAQLSSNLEGTYTAPEQQVLFDIGRHAGADSDEVRSLQEVANYSRALAKRKELVAKLPLSLRLIRELHRILMVDVRGAEKQPGEFRKVRVGIGRPARYVPPPTQLLGEPLASFERQLHSESWADPLVKAFLMHYQFEAIHPFRDGNGRVGRLLLAILAEEWCELSDQWLYMSSYFLDNRDTYHDRLLRVSTHGDWTGWVRFCLEGAAVSARDTDARCQKLLALKERYVSAAAESGGSYRLSSIIDGLFQRPVVTVPDVRDRFDITYPTAQSDVARLVGAGVLTEFASGRPKPFVASGLLEAIYE